MRTKSAKDKVCHRVELKKKNFDKKNFDKFTITYMLKDYSHYNNHSKTNVAFTNKSEQTTNNEAYASLYKKSKCKLRSRCQC